MYNTTKTHYYCDVLHNFVVSGNRPRKHRNLTPFGQNSSIVKVDRWSVGTLTTKELTFTLWRDSNLTTLRMNPVFTRRYSTTSSAFVEYSAAGTHGPFFLTEWKCTYASPQPGEAIMGGMWDSHPPANSI